MTRGQSHVVGVALLVGVTTLAMGGLTVAVGSVLEADTTALDASRVADDLDRAIQPVAATGRHTGQVSFLEGSLHTVERTVRLVNDSGAVRRVSADGVVYERGDTRVAAVFGAVVRGPPGQARLAREPSLALASGEVAVGVPVVGRTWSVGGRQVTASLHSRVTHERESYGSDEWSLAVETATPAVWERYFERRGATVERRDFDGDGTPSVVAQFPGDRSVSFVVHRLRLEVTIRGA